MMIGSLFSGIGGLELGLEWAGLGETVWQVEQSEFCRGVLAKHWPSAERFKDVREVGRHNLPPVDLICGGFPCQDISSAGRGAGLAGERSGLWCEFARIVGEFRPPWVVVENVASGARRWVDTVVCNLGQLGYETLPVPLSAGDVGAPHRRARIFLIAHADVERLEGREAKYRDHCGSPSQRMGRSRPSSHTNGQPVRIESWWGKGANGQGPAEPRLDGEWRVATDTYRNGEPAITEYEQMGWLCAPTNGGWEWRPPISPVCGVDDGIPDRMDRLKALGNAVVPQCAEVIGWVIQELVTKGIKRK